MKKVNIYNRGLIPWLHIQGPVFNSIIGDSTYFLLLKDSRVDIEIAGTPSANARVEEYFETLRKEKEEKEKSKNVYVSEYDALIKAEEEKSKKILAQINKSKEELSIKKEEIITEDKIEIKEEIQVKKEEESLNYDEEKEKTQNNEEIQILETTEELTKSEEEIDNEISMMLEEAMKVTSDEDLQIDPFQKKEEENIENKIPEEGKYTRAQLAQMTKKEMKEILKSRGYTEGFYAPKYHDTLEILTNKILETQ